MSVLLQKSVRRRNGVRRNENFLRDVLHLEGITSGAEIAVYSANGEQKYLGKSNGENMSVDVSHLSRGVYVLRVGRQAVKFIKE